MSGSFIFLYISLIFSIFMGNGEHTSLDLFSKGLIKDSFVHISQNVNGDTEAVIKMLCQQEEFVLQQLERINSILNTRKFIWITEASVLLILFASLILVIVHNISRNKNKNLAIIRQVQEVQQLISLNKTKEFQFLFSDLNKGVQDDSSESMTLLFERLQNLMAKERLYLNPNLCKEHILMRLDTDLRTLSVALKNRFNDASLSSYITSLRISEAIFLLENAPQYTIEEVSEKVGFSTCRTFYRQFKKKYDMTPSEYRKLTSF